MKKAQLKELRRIIATLPEIPLMEGGKAKTTAVHMSGGTVISKGTTHSTDGQPIQLDMAYSMTDRLEYVNKEKFFMDWAKSGKSVQAAIDYWNERYKKVTELIANYVEPPKKVETTEEIKQQIADEWEEQESRNGLLVHKGRRALGFPRHKRANKKKK